MTDETPTGLADVNVEISSVDPDGDNTEQYPTDGDTYKAIASFGQQRCDKLDDDVKRRCDWLYASMAGLVVTMVGVGLVWADAI